ncbi:MAG: ATP-binding protein [Methanomassiliicoccaceae archaeon]|nr:ATP-binding protein [Methanomassiliicoccaceae archaeon]
MFYGREQELKKMNLLYDSNDHHLIVVYGRRRVGKTTLIGEFCKDKKTLFFPALESTAEKNLKVFSRTINRSIYPDSSVNSEYASFDDAFTMIAETAKKERLVFVIDEFPYLAASDSSVSSVLQHAIDHKLSKTDIFVILCGSSMSFMENQVLGHNSPLYGRRTAQFRIEPLNYLKAAEAHPYLSPDTNAIIYGITGGIPHYINKLAVKNDNDVGNAVIQNVLERTGYLFEEPANLLKQELREPATYNAIIAAMAGGASRLNDIANRTSLEYAVCSKYLSVLVSLDIAGKKVPVYETAKNKTLYYLKDNLFNFWYNFIPDNMSQIVAGNAESVYKYEVEPQIDHYMGILFEEICRQYMIYYADLPFRIKEIGGWWGGNPETKKQEEVDIIAFSGKNAIFGECKWRSERTDLSVLNELKRKASLFRGFEKKYYYLFSRSGFTSGVISEAEQDDSLRLITLAEIYDP